MIQFFTEQLDYLLFIWSIAVLLLASVSFVFMRRSNQLPWLYFSLFSLLLAATKIIDLLMLGIGRPSYLAWLQAACLTASFLFLFEFGHVGSRRNRGLNLPGWIIWPFLLAAGLGLLQGLPWFSVTLVYLLGLPASLLASYAFWTVPAIKVNRILFRIFAVGSLLSTLVRLVSLPPDNRFPVSWINGDNLEWLLHFPPYLLSIVLALAASILLWVIYFHDDQQTPPEEKRRQLTPYVVGLMFFLVLTLVGGWFLTEYSARHEMLRIKQTLLGRVRTAVALLPVETIQRLSGTPEDQETEEYRSLKGRLHKIDLANLDVRFVYLMIWRNNQAVFLVDAEPEESPDFSPPGQIYTEAPPEVEKAFTGAFGQLSKPYTDRWGSWVSAFVPVLRAPTEEVVAVLGMDQDAGVLQKSIAMIRLSVIGLIFFFALLVITALTAVQQILERANRLAASEERFRGIVQLSPYGIVILDLNGRIVECNNAYSEMHDLPPPAQITGKNVLDLFADNRRPRLRELIADTLRTGRVFNFEYGHTRRDGRQIEAELAAVILRDPTGKPHYFLAVTHDITERKQMELATLRAKEAAEETNRAKSQFLASISHELRTPLNSIIGFSEIMHEQLFGQLNEKQIRYTKGIFTSGQHLLRLIDDLLDLSKVEAGKMTVHESQIELSGFLDSSLFAVQEQAAKRRLKLEYQLAAECAAIRFRSDELKLRQILFNLLSNAIKYTPEDGSIGVFVTREGKNLLFRISDTGAGIAPADQERIFEKFVQIDSPHIRTRDGTGLGLALTKNLVELLGGRIWVRSEGQGKGSSFYFTMPLKPTKTDDSQSDGWQSELNDLPMMQIPDTRIGEAAPLVLVVEDDIQAGELLTACLVDGGFRVARAFNGEQAIQLARELQPQIITLDVMLPKKDGLQLLAELKALPDVKHIPVVIISLAEKQALAFSLGAKEWLTKPVDKTLLLQTLQRLVQNEQQTRTVLIVEPDERLTADFVETMQKGGYRAFAVADGHEGIKITLAQQPDFILLNESAAPQAAEFLAQLSQHPGVKTIPIFRYRRDGTT